MPRNRVARLLVEATITVTNTADSGAGSLRSALASVADGDTINFSLPTPAMITLTNGQLAVSNSVSILGPAMPILSNALRNFVYIPEGSPSKR